MPMAPSNNRNGHMAQRGGSPSRRDFLKLAALSPLAYSVLPALAHGQSAAGPAGERPNVIVLEFDACSALNLSLYGYPRNTTPNLERFARRATVYHAHHSAGMFTTPGAGSLLTGLLPWTHRALQLGASIADAHRSHQAFAAFRSTHTTVAYAQNEFVDVFLNDAGQDLDVHIDSTRFIQTRRLLSGLPLLRNDRLVAYRGLDAGIFQAFAGRDSSIFLGPLNRILRLNERVRADRRFAAEYPLGLPDAGQGIFRLEDLVDGAIGILSRLPEPSFTFLHFFPPHGFYKPSAPFASAFDDGWVPIPKPVHPLSDGTWSVAGMAQARRLYDQYMASWDSEMTRLFDFMTSAGLFERSYVVLTADHGEMFERGEVGHEKPLMVNPLLRIPLIVWSPGQLQRRDVHTETSNIDVLPTLAHLVGNVVPSWSEGKLLPQLGGQEEHDRGVLSMDAQQNGATAPIRRMSLSLTKNGQRLSYYVYPDRWSGLEFYDLREDPEEMNNLYGAAPLEARRMEEELKELLAAANAPFE